MSEHHYREEMKKHTAEEALMKIQLHVIVKIMICTLGNHNAKRSGRKQITG